MLIIFDLDDTLIDTSGCITPFKLARALASMLGTDPTADQLEQLLQLNRELSRAKTAVEEMAKRLNVSDEARKRGLAELTAPLPANFTVARTPGSLEILQELKLLGPIALVTVGDFSFQHDKLEKAGIQASLFSKIAILRDLVKKPFYKDLAELFSVAPQDVWVCGDRISIDLLPAYELQFNTVHMRWGRGKEMASEPWIDHSISDLTELRKIIR